MIAMSLCIFSLLCWIFILIISISNYRKDKKLSPVVYFCAVLTCILQFLDKILK